MILKVLIACVKYLGRNTWRKKSVILFSKKSVFYTNEVYAVYKNYFIKKTGIVPCWKITDQEFWYFPLTLEIMKKWIVSVFFCGKQYAENDCIMHFIFLGENLWSLFDEVR